MGISTTPSTGFSVALADGTDNVRINTGAHPSHPGTGGNVWTMFTVVVDKSANTMYVYVDDGTTGPGGWTGSDNIAAVGDVSTAEDLDLGKRADSAANYFDGMLDEVRILDRTLSATEVSTLYNSMSNPSSFLPNFPNN